MWFRPNFIHPETGILSPRKNTFNKDYCPKIDRGVISHIKIVIPPLDGCQGDSFFHFHQWISVGCAMSSQHLWSKPYKDGAHTC